MVISVHTASARVGVRKATWGCVLPNPVGMLWVALQVTPLNRLVARLVRVFCQTAMIPP